MNSHISEMLLQAHARSLLLDVISEPTGERCQKRNENIGIYNPETISSEISKIDFNKIPISQKPVVSEVQNAVLRCKISGLLIAKLPGLPWGAIPHSLPFSSYSWKEIHKFFQLATKESASNETKHFCLFSLLAKLPVDFSQLNARSTYYYYELTDKTMQSVYSRGLQRLYNISNFYSGLELRYQNKFPKWRIGTFTDSEAKEDSRHIFANFFNVISLWEQQALAFEFKGVKEKGKRLQSDSELVLKQDSENVYEEVQESVYKKMRELQKNTIITIFDVRSIDRKKLSAVILMLREFYKLSNAEYKEFHYIVYAAKDCGISRLEKLKGFIQDKAALCADYPIEHTYFLNFLRFHIEAKKRVEQMLSIVQEEQENNPIFVKLRDAETKQLESLHAKGMPKREDFKTSSSYLSAVMNWKKTQSVIGMGEKK